jgi:hypothetical protein
MLYAAEFWLTLKVVFIPYGNPSPVLPPIANERFNAGIHPLTGYPEPQSSPP